MSAVEDIMSQIPLGQLAGQLGVNEPEAEQAVRTALPALLGGINLHAGQITHHAVAEAHGMAYVDPKTML